MERSTRRKCHYIYRTTCIITNRFYIGMHSTDNLEDGYIGSGKRLWHSINKHGKDNHVCEILEFLPDRSSLKAREKEIVNKELINEELCMNLQIGGEGGFISHEHMMKANKNSRISFAKKLKGFDVTVLCYDIQDNVSDENAKQVSFAELQQHTHESTLYFREHPLNKHYKGIEDPREWMIQTSQPAQGSFFSFWKKYERQIEKEYF